MSFSVGIVGLPNVGKSTLFKTLTKREVKISPRPFTTIEPNVGMVSVPDERLEKIAQVINPEKITPTKIEFVDIAGLVKGAHLGEGLGNQFLSYIRTCDAILMVIRCFEKENVENVLGEINPQKEIEILETELLMKDLETVEKAISKAEKKDKKKLTLLEKLKSEISKGKLIREIELKEEELEMIKEYQFLTQKPRLYLLNVNSQTKFLPPKVPHFALNLKEEEEILDLNEKEKEELGLKSEIEKIIENCYKILDLITFYTVVGGKETRAWTAKRGISAKKAAGIVHSDFEKKFIKAEVIFWEELVKIKSWQKAKEKGLVKIVGKDYQIKDGQVIEFKI